MNGSCFKTSCTGRLFVVTVPEKQEITMNVWEVFPERLFPLPWTQVDAA